MAAFLISEAQGPATRRNESSCGYLPGRGSYGAVYKARDRATGDIVAVKIVPLSEGDDPAEMEHEITVLAACDHPNVVRYLVSTTFGLISALSTNLVI